MQGQITFGGSFVLTTGHKKVLILTEGDRNFLYLNKFEIFQNLRTENLFIDVCFYLGPMLIKNYESIFQDH